MYNFAYYDPEYKKLQSELTKLSWLRGEHDSLRKSLVTQVCKNPECRKEIKTQPSEMRPYCSHGCAAHMTNQRRKLSEATKLKISKAISAFPRSFFQKKTLPKIPLICIGCGKKFEVVPFQARTRKYCSIHCSISTIGHRTTSPKASKGKPGVRTYVDPSICFYSTWEANVARVFTLIGLNWVYAPKIFHLGEHTYRPDFYLPDFDMFIEVKNFMGEYSLQRDTLFRKKFPNLKLELIMKEEYEEIKENYKYFIRNWEY